MLKKKHWLIRFCEWVDDTPSFTIVFIMVAVIVASAVIGLDERALLALKGYQ